MIRIVEEDAMETCENCERSIGKLETPQLWNGKIVCALCRNRLAGTNSVPREKLLVAMVVAAVLGGAGTFAVTRSVRRLAPAMGIPTNQKPPQPSPQPSSPSLASAATNVSGEYGNFKRFLDRLLPAIQSTAGPEKQRIDNTLGSIAPDTNASTFVTGELVSLVDTDFVRQDSVIYPFAGVATLREAFWIEDPKSKERFTEAWNGTITFVPESDGTWRPTKEFTKTDLDEIGSAFGRPGVISVDEVFDLDALARLSKNIRLVNGEYDLTDAQKHENARADLDSCEEELANLLKKYDGTKFLLICGGKTYGFSASDRSDAITKAKQWCESQSPAIVFNESSVTQSADAAEQEKQIEQVRARIADLKHQISE